ncbi:2'-5' RNA ligase family protein [Rhizobium sp. 2YAF20]|uniref:2'-5' RNA ligase family protein n=1 Tax=Rhizobium sp. 2YAF20 TaxID=3233027 RepID=UPI003F9A7371
MFGITLATQSTAEPFWALVDKASAFESSPSIRTLGYVPHITLSLYAAIAVDDLVAKIDAFAGEETFELTFDKMSAFDTDPVILWLAPNHDQRLVDLHERLQSFVNPSLCDPHYRPDLWRPHLTVAIAISSEQRQAALAFAARPIEPFKIRFERIDFVSWPPISVLKMQALSGQGSLRETEW